MSTRSTLRKSLCARDATLVVGFAAALWGLDGLLRKPLAAAMDAGTVVLWEHAIALLALSPFLLGSLRVFIRLDIRSKLAIVTIGMGASASATTLFTRSFVVAARAQDFVTPLVLQKLQPIFAVSLAVIVLHERLRPRFAFFIVPALAGAWLLTFTDPLDVRVAQVEPALFAIGAAALWAFGTVLGRLVSPSLTPVELTTLRYVFGLVGAIIVAWLTKARATPGWHNVFGLLLLALIPGLIALATYYWALRRTPASRATIAELAFPATAAVVGVLFLHARLTGTQWLGFAVVALSVCALGWHESRQLYVAVEMPVQSARGDARSLPTLEDC